MPITASAAFLANQRKDRNSMEAKLRECERITRAARRKKQKDRERANIAKAMQLWVTGKKK